MPTLFYVSYAALWLLALLPLLCGWGPEATMALLPRLRPAAQRLNALVAVGGGLLLVVLACR